MAWSEEKLAEAVSLYTSKLSEFSEDEQPLHSMEIVRQVADEIGETPNGVRLKLSASGVYVKAKRAAPVKAATASTGAKRINKAEAIQSLVGLIEAQGITLEAESKEIIDKLTGKAAAMFADIISTIVTQE